MKDNSDYIDSVQWDKSSAAQKVSARIFLRKVLIAAVACLVIVIASNVYIDIYGLFRPVKDRALQVYNNDRLSKYLLSYHYIPENFNTIILGTSLSANLDITEFNNQQRQYRIYNASIMGANISDLKPLASSILEKGSIRNVIICFSPYMIKNSGTKDIEFGPKLFFGALGSKNLYETYAIALIRKNDLLPGKFPKNQINEYGVNRFSELFKVPDVKQKIAAVMKEHENDHLYFDSAAIKDLQGFLSLLKDKHVRYIGYFHPVPHEILQSKKADYDAFQEIVRGLVKNDGTLVDLNTDDFNYFTTDYSNYVDHNHLSVKGQSVVTKILCDHLRTMN